MSRDVIVGIEIVCDGEDCNEKIIIRSDDVTLYPSVDVTEAEKKGWQCSWKEDLCPVCFTER